MKNAFLLIFFIISSVNIQAQIEYPPERITAVATLDRGLAITLEVPASELFIKANIIKLLELKDTNFELINPTFKKRPGLGWYLQYEFESDGKIGLYREQLHERNGQLVISESRSAEMGMATNCEKIIFTNDNER